MYVSGHKTHLGDGDLWSGIVSPDRRVVRTPGSIGLHIPPAEEFDPMTINPKGMHSSEFRRPTRSASKFIQEYQRNAGPARHRSAGERNADSFRKNVTSPGSCSIEFIDRRPLASPLCEWSVQTNPSFGVASLLRHRSSLLRGAARGVFRGDSQSSPVSATRVLECSFRRESTRVLASGSVDYAFMSPNSMYNVSWLRATDVQ